MKRILPGDLIWLAVLAIITAFFIVPSTHQIFVRLTGEHPYIMGFIKFAVLATMGELLVKRLARGAWQKLPGLVYKILVWGIIGVMVTFVFSLYSLGTAAVVEKGLLPAGSGGVKTFLLAFFTSTMMNLTFGPVFMAAHRVSDTFIDLRVQGKKVSLKNAVERIDWADFVNFVVAKTIPFLWIPAHTIAFLLPAEYRVLVAAYLSIVLGIVLVYARSRKSK